MKHIASGIAVAGLGIAMLLTPVRTHTLEQWREEAEQERLQIPAGTDLAALMGNPTEIESGIESGDDAVAVASFADVHAVYEVDLEVLRDTIVDFDRYEQFVPHVELSDGRRIGDDPLRWMQLIEIAYGVLVFQAEYALDNEFVVVQDEDVRFALVFRMAESHDGRLADSFGSWFLETVDIDGRPATYVRYYSYVAFAEDMPGLRVALQMFGLQDVKAVMNAYVDEARERGA